MIGFVARSVITVVLVAVGWVMVIGAVQAGAAPGRAHLVTSCLASEPASGETSGTHPPYEPCNDYRSVEVDGPVNWGVWVAGGIGLAAVGAIFTWVFTKRRSFPT